MGRQNYNLTPNPRNEYMGWLPVEKEIMLATLEMAHSVANYNTPEELASQMSLNNTGHRIQMQKKFAAKPPWLNTNKLCKISIRSIMYFYNTLPKEITTVFDKRKFKKSLKNHIKI